VIYLVPHSGLANRLRAIVSGFSLAKEMNQPIKVIWKKDDGCNVDFYEIFQPVAGLELSQDNWETRCMKLARGKKLLRWLPTLVGIDFFMFDENFKQYVWCNKSHIFNPGNIKKNARDIYINTCNDFYYQKEVMELFKPINEIQIIIESYTKKFSSKTIGIHIRRTDNLESIKYSPLELYIEEMKFDLSQDSEVDFFLATDDIETEKMLENLFPGKIITIKKELARGSKIGMVGAIVDLYCLAKCSRIYGSYYSSFSDIASRIGSIPLKILKNA
jgi:hypothetical protein